MAILPRSSVITAGDTVRLGFVFRDQTGTARDTDTYPTISIIQPSGNVLLAPTSAGVYQAGTGTYFYNLAMCPFPPIGVWNDIWSGYIDGFRIAGQGSFTVNTTQLPANNTDGYAHLGDDPGFYYSQTATRNINSLIKSLRARLKSSGKRYGQDENGNVMYQDCDVFQLDELVAFIAMSLSMFNDIPTFTMFTFDDSPIIEMFHAIIVQGATHLALAAQALIERGREFAITDNGVGFTPPTMSELLNGQSQKELDVWTEKVKQIKANMRPSPLGLGSLRPMHASSQIRRLRFLRQRQVF